MNKAELAHRIAERVGLSKSQGEAIVSAFVDIIVGTLKADGKVTIAGFGEFSARERKGRIGVNPQNPSEKIPIPAVRVAKFKAGSVLKKTLKGQEEAPAPQPAPEPEPTDAPESETPAPQEEAPSDPNDHGQEQQSH